MTDKGRPHQAKRWSNDQAIISFHIDFTSDRITDREIGQIGKLDRENTETGSCNTSATQ